MGRSRYKIIDPVMPHFMTCTILHWIPLFTRPATVEIIYESLVYLMKDGLKLYAYVILENHLHLIAQSRDLNRDIARFKSFTANQLIKYLKQNHLVGVIDQLQFYKKAHKRDRLLQLWQEGIHPEWIQNEAMMKQKIDYIHHNPVKRGYVDQARDWRYSSARNYLGETGLIDVTSYW